MTNTIDKNTAENGGKRKYRKKTLAEKEAELKAALADIQAKKALETMADHPVMAKILSIREKLDYRRGIDHNLVHGYGKGRPVVERIAALRRELTDLEASAERAVAFLPGVDNMMRELDFLQANVLDGKISEVSQVDFSFLTEEFKGWTETETERIKRLEKEARAEQNRRSKTEPETEPETETVEDIERQPVS